MKALCTIPLLVCVSAFGGYDFAVPDRSEERQFVGATQPSKDLSIGCAQSGVIAEMAVRPGQRVAKGQLLFRLTTAREDLEVERLAVLAKSDAELRQAKARFVEAEREEARSADLHRRGIAGDADLDERRRALTVARLELDRLAVAHRAAALRHKEAVARRDERIVRSPIDGYVAERMHDAGEAVEELVPVVRVVSLAPLYVEFDCPLAHAQVFGAGTKVDVQPAAGGKAHRAVVHFASAVADAASQTFKVRLTLHDGHRLKSGVKVFVRAKE